MARLHIAKTLENLAGPILLVVWVVVFLVWVVVKMFQKQKVIPRSTTPVREASPKTAPIDTQTLSTLPGATMQQEQAVTCPKCGSSQITANSKGFSVGKAAVGFLLAPGGVLWGMHGKDKILVSFMKCGHQWKPCAK
jgi:hypothetical protein